MDNKTLSQLIHYLNTELQHTVYIPMHYIYTLTHLYTISTITQTQWSNNLISGLNGLLKNLWTQWSRYDVILMYSLRPGLTGLLMPDIARPPEQLRYQVHLLPCGLPRPGQHGLQLVQSSPIPYFHGEPDVFFGYFPMNLL